MQTSQNISGIKWFNSTDDIDLRDHLILFHYDANEKGEFGSYVVSVYNPLLQAFKDPFTKELVAPERWYRFAIVDRATAPIPPASLPSADPET
jgi:hypothetical protein